MSSFNAETSSNSLAYVCEQQYLCKDDNEDKACGCLTGVLYGMYMY